MHFEETLKCLSNLLVDTVPWELSVFQLMNKNYWDLKKKKKNDLDESDQIEWNYLTMFTLLKSTSVHQIKDFLLISILQSQDWIYVTQFQCLIMIQILTSLILITYKKNSKRWMKLNLQLQSKHHWKHQLNTEIFKNLTTLTM